MATTTADDVQVSGTDYRFQGMTDGYLARAAAEANAHSKMSVDTQGALAKGFAFLNSQLDQLTAFMTALFPSLVTSSVNALNAVGADDAMAFVKIGASLANSASPPTPAYQNLGTAGPGQSQGYPGGATPFYLPPKGTTTVTTA